MILPGFKNSTTHRSILLDAAVALTFSKLSTNFKTEPLKKLSTMTSGGTPSRNSPEYYGGTIPWVKISDISAAGKWLCDTEETINEDGLKNSSAVLFPEGTVLFSMYGSVGKTAITKCPLTTNQAILGLIPHHPITSEYLYYSLIFARDTLFSRAKGTSQKNINGKMVKNFQIPVIPDDLSKDVVNFLSAIEDERDLSAIYVPIILEEIKDNVVMLEWLLANIEEARKERVKAVQHFESLIQVFKNSLINNEKWQTTTMSELLIESPRNGLSPQRQVESSGKRMFRINAVSSSKSRFVDSTAYKLVDVSNGISKPFIAKDGDIFIVRYNGDINRVAKAAIYKGNNGEEIIYPDKLIRVRPDPQKMIPDFLVYALNSKDVRNQIERLGKTTAGQIGVNGSDVKSFVIPVPPLSEQHRIVAHLDHLQSKVDEVKRLQAETEREMEALVPAVLAKAFGGDLE